MRDARLLEGGATVQTSPSGRPARRDRASASSPGALMPSSLVMRCAFSSLSAPWAPAPCRLSARRQCLSAPQPCDNPQDAPYQRLTPPKRSGQIKASWARAGHADLSSIAEVVVNAFTLIGLGGIVGLMSACSAWRRLSDHAAAVLYRHPAGDCGGDRGQSGRRLVVFGRLAHVRHGRFPHGLGAAGGGLSARRWGAAVQPAVAAGPGRSGGAALLCRLSGPDQGDDAAGKPARAAPPGSAARSADAAQPARLGASLAAEDEIPRLGAVYQRHSGSGRRRAWWAFWARSWGSAAASSWCRR